VNSNKKTLNALRAKVHRTYMADVWSLRLVDLFVEWLICILIKKTIRLFRNLSLFCCCCSIVSLHVIRAVMLLSSVLSMELASAIVVVGDDVGEYVGDAVGY
jgi:hypothetical protein